MRIVNDCGGCRKQFRFDPYTVDALFVLEDTKIAAEFRSIRGSDVHFRIIAGFAPPASLKGSVHPDALQSLQIISTPVRGMHGARQGNAAGKDHSPHCSVVRGWINERELLDQLVQDAREIGSLSA